jgi:hypothetical protein
MTHSNGTTVQPFGAVVRPSGPQAAAPPKEVFQRETLKIGTFGKVLAVVLVAAVVLFPPRMITGGFGTIGHGLWIVIGLVSATPFLAIMTFGAFFAFGRSSRAGNIAFCAVLILDLFSVLTMPITLAGLAKARERAREVKYGTSPQSAPAPRAAAAPSMVPSAPRVESPKPRGDRPPPVVRVRKSGG